MSCEVRGDDLSSTPVYSNARRRRQTQRRRILLFGVLVLILAAAAFFVFRSTGLFASSDTSTGNARSDTPLEDQLSDPVNGDSAGGNGSNATGSTSQETPKVEAPDEVRAIYLTAANAANPQPFFDMMDRTNINAVVVDVKDVTGEVMYPSEVPLANEIGATRDTLDIESLANELEERDIYAIARVATFEDDILPVQRPDLAVTDSATGAQWQNYAGNYWSDPHNREVWEYNVGVAKEAADAGFDEIQFDYVRFPSDGPMETLTYSRNSDQDKAIADFLEYANEELDPTGVNIAADVFGLVATIDTVGVGQNVREIAPYLDVINPMVYPSHFPAGSYGLENPNANPYEVIEKAVADFEEDAEAANPDMEIRPWLQDFDYGAPAYGPDAVAAQIQATRNSNATGWLLWNPSNEYTEEALTEDGEAMTAAAQQYSGE